MGSIMVRASDSRPEGLVPCLNWAGGDRWCRHLSSLRGISPRKFVLSPVWCSRPTTGVLLAPCQDEFVGPRSDYVRQVALKQQQQFYCRENKIRSTHLILERKLINLDKNL
ncbi:uncharacterized protein TNCV_1115681 [Trichonephila clavipes]|nr:uncharacterized protein TNCV_1115681 [Trichonephila clavipes]